MKVLIVKIFSGQVMIKVRDEPVFVCRGPANTIIVATKVGCIEVHSISLGKSHLILRFKCVAQVVCLGVLGGEDIVSVESDQCVRVYSNWQDQDNQQVSCFSLASSCNGFVVCGAGSRRFLVSTKNGLHLFDFQDGEIIQILDISVQRASKLALYGDYIGWSLGAEVRVLCVKFCSVQHKAPSYDEICVNVVLNGGAASASELLLPSLVSSIDPFVALGPHENYQVGINASAEERWHVESCNIVLVQRCRRSVHSLQFARESSLTEQGELVRCLVSTEEEALLFSLSDPSVLAKYTYTSPTVLAVLDDCFLYAVQRPSKKGSNSSVEVFTLRPSQSSLPVTGDAFDEWTLVGLSAMTLPPPCLVSSLPFVGLKAIESLGGGGSLVLMSKVVNEADAFWSVSVLQAEKAVEIWRELASKALAAKKEEDHEVFLQLHLEGFLLLGSRLKWLQYNRTNVCEEEERETVQDGDLSSSRRRFASLNVSSSSPSLVSFSSKLSRSFTAGTINPNAWSFEVEKEKEEDAEATRSLFLESCRIIGDFCEARKLFHSATVFWSLGALPVDELTRRLLPEREAADALASYVKDRIMKNDARMSMIGVGVGNSLIEHLAKHAPSELPNAVLKGSSLVHDPSLAAELLVRLGTELESFARAYCLAVIGDEAECLKVLRLMDSNKIVELLVMYESSWKTQNNALNLMGECVFRASSFALLEAISRLRYGSSDCVSLLGGPQGVMFLIYLESVVTNANLHQPERDSAAMYLARGYLAKCVAGPSEMCLPSEWTASIEQFESMRMVDLEETSLEVRWTLKHWKGFKHSRAPWMEKVPPFDGKNAKSDIKKFFYLSKLQGLLFYLSNERGSFERALPLLSTALQEGSGSGNWKKWCSMFWLPFCGQMRSALQLSLSVGFCNEAYLGYCQEYNREPEHWRIALQIVAESILSSEDDDLDFKKKKQNLYSSVVLHCAEKFSPEVCLSQILPQNGSLSYFLPILLQSFDNHSTILQSLSNYDMK